MSLLNIGGTNRIRPSSKRLKLVSALTAGVFAAVFSTLVGPGSVSPAQAQLISIPTRVFLNGVPTPVSFNDGDSFRVMAGRYQGTRARLSGFNTLESYGNVHHWGSWKEKELYHLARLATENARRGVWHCESQDLARDTYGRILWWCKDLAVDQVRRGLAHAMTVTLEGANKDVLAAQEDAIAHRRGIWAHGIPEYILTSLHSVLEGSERANYNRLVSTRDGHSAKWLHQEAYGRCQKVCSKERIVEKGRLKVAIERVRRDPKIKEIAESLSEEGFENVVGDFARLGHFAGIPDAQQADKLRAKLSELDEVGHFGTSRWREGSCVVYVSFEARYGRRRAGCLDG